jgi:quercetin dioxygenase-like cupin family protein
MQTNHNGGPISSAYPAGQTHGSPVRAMRQVDQTLLTFDLSGELEALRAEATWQNGSRNSKTLVKEPLLRIVLIALRAGDRMEQHQAPGAISIQALAGTLRLQVLDETIELTTGRMVVIDANVVHSVEALDECAFLLTLAWPQPVDQRAD